MQYCRFSRRLFEQHVASIAGFLVGFNWNSMEAQSMQYCRFYRQRFEKHVASIAGFLVGFNIGIAWRLRACNIVGFIVSDLNSM